MGRDRKKLSVWEVYLRAEVVAVIVYVLGVCLLALLASKGVLPERGVFPLLLAWALFASLLAGGMAVRKAPFGRLSAALLAAAVFAVTLLLIGVCAWQEISWTGKGGALLLSVLIGGVLAAMTGNRKQRGGKRARKK